MRPQRGFSRFAGRNWGVNTVATAQAFNASIAVLADGTIGLIHYDLRFNTPDPATLPTDVWFLHSHNAGATWFETRVTPTSFDINRAPVARGLFLGDYMGLAARGAQFASAYGVATATDRANILVSLLNP